MSEAAEIEVRRSDIHPGRWNFYIRGERRGSAHSKKRAEQMAKEMLETIESHRKSLID